MHRFIRQANINECIIARVIRGTESKVLLGWRFIEMGIFICYTVSNRVAVNWGHLITRLCGIPISQDYTIKWGKNKLL